MRAMEHALRFLVQHGVQKVFGIPAGSINALYDALLDIPELNTVIVKHEATAGYMACSYTRITGLPSICVASSGPGATNMVTAAANAWKEKLPVLFITGSVPTTKMGKGAGQELLAEPIFSSITKWSKTIMDPHQLTSIIAEAYTIAMEGVPGPVHLAIPINIQMTEIGDPPIPSISPVELCEPNSKLISDVALLIHQTGMRGAILLGHGAKSSEEELIQLVERIGWPVATTPRGKGAFPEDHPLSLGVYGLAGNPLAINYLNGNDHEVLLVIGSSLGESETCNWDERLTKSKQLIHVDIDPAEFGKNYEPQIAVRGDAIKVIRGLITEWDRLKPKQWSDHIEEVAATLQEPISDRIVPMDSNKSEWNTQIAIQQIGACAPINTRFYVDIGELMTYAIQNLCILKDQQFDLDISLGGMGSAISGSLGAQLAEPDRPVFCLTGDGCFFMHGMEILTAKEYNIPVIMFVINNARLGMVYHGHMMQYNRCANDFSQQRVDIAQMVKSLGIRTAQVRSLADLQPYHFEEWVSYKEPVVVEIIVDGYEIPPMGERVKFLQKAVD